MKSFKLVVILFCVVLLSDQSLAVLNKSTNKNVKNDSFGGDKKSENNAEDRISNEYGVPRPGLSGPAPVYGPPELTGNHAPVQIFPPPPAELPPPPPPQNFGRPHSSYGPPRKIPQFGPRPHKIAPWKLAGSSSRFPGFQGPASIPVSLESYGPPANLPPPSFSVPRPEYGAPLPLPPIPQAPPPGVPAPPTPPDIKYDGWQPIAGHVESPNVNVAPGGNHFDHSANVNANLPSNSYGEPINNPEDHNLKQSVDQGDQGLPPPKLPETEILHNIQEAAQSIPPHSHDSQQHSNSFESLPTATSNLASSFNSDASSGYESARGNSQSQDLSFQLPPPGPTNIISDSYGAPPPSSFSSGGHYASSNFGSNFGYRQQQYRHHSSSFPSFRPRGHGPFRPHGLSNSLIPPRSRAPIKFRESVPSGLLNSIGSYLPPPQIIPSGPIKPASTYGQPPRFGGFSFQQQLPTLKQSHSFHSSGSYEKSPLAAPNVNYGTPLTFTSFNTPAPVLTYGAPNFGPTGSFISSSNIAGGNLYDQHSILSTSYGSPQVFNGHHDCSGFQQKPIETPIQLSSLSSHNSQGNLDSSSSIGGGYPVPSINELDLEPPHSSNQQSQIKDSYGNPTGTGAGIYDQRSASSVVTNFNSQTIVNSAGTAEALTAALTAQGYGSQSNQDNYNDQHPTDSYNQGTNNVVSTANTLNVDQLSQLHGDSEPALALAQTLSAEGASPDGFQIQGSKGTYSLQIQSANGLQHNSDGSIRHDQLLSDGLLQDILAAIEQPGNGAGKNHLVQIQGGPQAQQLAEIHQQIYEPHHSDDLSHAASSSLVSSANAEGIMNPEDVALFFNNNYSEQNQKEIRSTAKSEGNIENLIKSSSEEKTEEKKSS